MDAMREQIRVLQRRMEEMQRRRPRRGGAAHTGGGPPRHPPRRPRLRRGAADDEQWPSYLRSVDGNFTMGITGRVHFNAGTCFQGSSVARDNPPKD